MRRRQIIAGGFFGLFLSLAFVLHGEEQPGEADIIEQELDIRAMLLPEEAPQELVDMDLDDPDVSLRIAGRWRGTLQGGWGMALTPLGASVISGDAPLFTQEGDLTLSLWIRNRWFVEVGFMDHSALNTYRAGYQGLEGDPIRYVGIGNVGLDFPSFPFLDLGGDSPSSFGFYGHFGAGTFSLHTLVRYDAAAREERVFVGGRERSFNFADLSRPQRGTSFVLPDYNLDSIPVVFIQDNRGNLTDSEGRRWRLAESSEFGASAGHGIVELTLGRYTGGMTEPEGMIAVAYSRNGNNQPWVNSMGTYSTPGPAGTFLRDVQDFFGEIRLWDFPQPGQHGTFSAGSPAITANIPGTVIINGVPALVIFEPGTFSPFERQNRYIAPVSESAEAAIVSLSTGAVDTRFELIPLDDSPLEVFFLEPQQRFIRRGVYELILLEGRRDPRSEAERWPLGRFYPELYLPGRLPFTADLGMRFTNYFGAPGAYFIGTDVVPGSVQVFRSGIQDPNFIFSPATGIVTLRNPAGFSEVIRITYLRQSNERRLGSLAAGIGAIWEPEGPFTGRVGIGLRWNVASEAYSEAGAASPGTVGLGAEARWTHDRFSAGLTLGLGFHQPDTTGLYRAAGMEGNELILPLPSGSSFISETPASVDTGLGGGQRADLIYRNFLEHSVFFGTSLADISSAAPVIPGESGPYPAMDRAFSSQIQVLVAEFEFSSGDSWTGFQVPLGANGEFLEQAGRIDIPFRFMNFSENLHDADDIQVILQIGALASRDTGGFENPNLTLERRLFPPGPGVLLYPGTGGTLDTSARIASFDLDDSERARLQNAAYLRLLIIRPESSNAAGDLQGRVILAPPIVWGSFWRPVVVAAADNGDGIDINSTRTTGNKVNVVEEIDFSLERTYPGIINRLNSAGRNRVLSLSWHGFSGANTGPGVDGRLPAIPLSNYRSLSFFLRRPQAAFPADQDALDDATLRFIIARGPSSVNRANEIALEASIPLAAFSGVAPGEWARVDLQYRGTAQRVLVGGAPVSGASVIYRNSAANFNGGHGMEGVMASYAAFFLVPGNYDIPAGNMALDEIILEDSIPSYRLNSGASVEWAHPGVVLRIREQAILSNLSFQAALESAAEGNPFEDEGNGDFANGSFANGSFGMSGRTVAAFSLFGFRISGNYSYTLNAAHGTETGHTWAAGHSVSRSFGPFFIQDSFENAPDDRTMKHRVAIALRTRIRGNIYGEAVYEDSRLRRRWQAGTGGRLAREFPLYLFVDTQAGINERLAGSELELGNYAETWLNSFDFLLPDSGAGSESRDARGSFRARLGTSPLGTEFYFRGTSSFSRLRETSQSTSLARLDFPFNPAGRNFRLLFRSEREYRRELFGESFDFHHDGEIWAESLADAMPLMLFTPFRSLFDPNMGNYMNEFASAGTSPALEPNSSLFADRIEFTLLSSGNYGVSSLFLPNRVSFRLSRILEQRLDTPRDSLNLGAVLGFSAVNMFGAMGAVPLFSFYQGDEFSHALETTLSFPKGEAAAWSIRATQNAFFFGFTGAELSFSNTLTMNSSARAGEGIRVTDILTMALTSPRENTLLGTLYAAFARRAREQDSWIASNLAQYEYELLGRQTLEFVFERVPNAIDGDYNRFSFAVGHESIVRIFGRLNLSAFGRLNFSQDANTRIFSFFGTIGTTLHLMF